MCRMTMLVLADEQERFQQSFAYEESGMVPDCVTGLISEMEESDEKAQGNLYSARADRKQLAR